ncbi:hypothetical protein HQ545_03045, partial [Candidatus Woesearchaeota archaeon]|nr:hypothetical protein [Candidatus Woesearchaeota archaeon]
MDIVTERQAKKSEIESLRKEAMRDTAITLEARRIEDDLEKRQQEI